MLLPVTFGLWLYWQDSSVHFPPLSSFLSPPIPSLLSMKHLFWPPKHPSHTYPPQAMVPSLFSPFCPFLLQPASTPSSRKPSPTVLTLPLLSPVVGLCLLFCYLVSILKEVYRNLCSTNKLRLRVSKWQSMEGTRWRRGGGES